MHEGVDASKGPRRANPRASLAVLVGLLLVLTPLLTACGSSTTVRLPNLSSPIVSAPTIDGAAPVQGPLKSTDGPFLTDALGRVIFLHGVNAVYKLRPYELYPAPGKP